MSLFPVCSARFCHPRTTRSFFAIQRVLAPASYYFYHSPRSPNYYLTSPNPPSQTPIPRLFTTTTSIMAVPPRFSGHKMCFSAPPAPTASGVPSTKHTLELFLDYVCPYSAKMYNTVFSTIIPLIRSTESYSRGIELVFRQQIQPWHPSSTLVHEAALAVLALCPEKFWDYSAQLFQHQTEYFDASLVDEPRNKTYERLCKLAAETCGIDEGKMMDMLRIDNKPGPNGELNSGNKVTNDVKLIVKMNRLVGMHVTPSVIFDGVPYHAIESSWGKEQWSEFLKEHCPPPSEC